MLSTPFLRKAKQNMVESILDREALKQQLLLLHLQILTLRNLLSESPAVRLIQGMDKWPIPTPLRGPRLFRTTLAALLRTRYFVLSLCRTQCDGRKRATRGGSKAQREKQQKNNLQLSFTQGTNQVARGGAFTP